MRCINCNKIVGEDLEICPKCKTICGKCGKDINNDEKVKLYCETCREFFHKSCGYGYKLNYVCPICEANGILTFKNFKANDELMKANDELMKLEKQSGRWRLLVYLFTIICIFTIIYILMTYIVTPNLNLIYTLVKYILFIIMGLTAVGAIINILIHIKTNLFECLIIGVFLMIILPYEYALILFIMYLLYEIVGKVPK